jgi:hypothetical protein
MLAGGDASLAFVPGSPCAAMEAVTCGAAAPGTELTMRQPNRLPEAAAHRARLGRNQNPAKPSGLL